MKWVSSKGPNGTTWTRTRVQVPYGKKMAMVIVEDPKTRRKVTRHMII